MQKRKLKTWATRKRSVNMEIWEHFKWVVAFVFAPLIAFVGKSILNRIADLEKRSSDHDKDLAVIKSQMSDMQSDIREIKDGINKIVEKLYKS